MQSSLCHMFIRILTMPPSYSSDFISSPSLLLFVWLCCLFDIWMTNMLQLSIKFCRSFNLISTVAFFSLSLFWLIDMKPALIILFYWFETRPIFICWYKVHPYYFVLLIWNPPLLLWFVDMKSILITRNNQKVVVRWINTYCI